MLDSSKVTSLKSALKHVRNFWNGRIRYMLLNTLTLKWNGFFSSSGTYRFSFLEVHRRKKTEALLIDFFSASTFLCVQGKSLYEHYVNTIHI